MKFKKIITLIIIMCTIILTGCADVQFIRMIDSNNAVQDKIVVELNKSEIEKRGYKMADVLNKIEEDFIAVKNYIECDWIEQFNNDKYANVYDKAKNGIVVDVTPPVGNKITLTITFADLSMFGLFYGYSSIDNNYEYNKAMEDVGPFIGKMFAEDYDNEDFGMFLIKYSIIKDNGILDSLENFEVNGVNYYTNYSQYLNEELTKENIKMSEIFIYPDDRIYSNADDKEVINGVTFLHWSLSDKNDGFQMEIYKIAPKVINWYICAIIVSIVFVIIASIIIIVKVKLKKRRKQEVIDE